MNWTPLESFIAIVILSIMMIGTFIMAEQILADRALRMQEQITIVTPR